MEAAELIGAAEEEAIGAEGVGVNEEGFLRGW